MQIDCIIIEDEPLAADKLAGFIKKVPYLNLKGRFINPVSANIFLKTASVELIFLDIEMDGMTGIEFLESISPAAQIIITTAYEKYALKGYEFKVADYLVKPYPFQRFFKAVEYVYQQLAPNKKKQLDFFFVKTEYRAERISFDEVLYIEGMSDYRYIKTNTRNMMTLQTFSELETMLPPEKICRVHKSYMVSVSKIESIERGRIKIKDQLIPISDTYRSKVYDLLNIS